MTTTRRVENYALTTALRVASLFRRQAFERAACLADRSTLRATFLNALLDDASFP